VRHPALFRAAAWLAPVVLHYDGKGPGAGGRGPVGAGVQGQEEAGGRGPGSRGQGAGGEEQRSRFKVQRSGESAKIGRVAFFPGCAVQYFQPEIGKATIAVLHAVGFEVIVPDGLKCCGRPLLSLGDRRAAEGLAAQNAALFETLKVDAIVTSCASCGLTFKKEYPALLPPGAKTPAVLDIHEFLAGRIVVTDLAAVRRSVTIHDPCHLGRGQGLSRVVRDLLQTIPGISLIEMRDADRCCGFGGVMRITNRKLSDGIAGEKVRRIIESGASTVAAGCPGCRMQIADALRRHGSEIQTVHTVQILAEALPEKEPEVEQQGPRVR